MCVPAYNKLIKDNGVMCQFFRDNAVWITPVLVAVVTGVFMLLSKKAKGNRKNKQVIKHVNNSTVTQINGDDGEK